MFKFFFMYSNVILNLHTSSLWLVFFGLFVFLQESFQKICMLLPSPAAINVTKCLVFCLKYFTNADFLSMKKWSETDDTWLMYQCFDRQNYPGVKKFLSLFKPVKKSLQTLTLCLQ